MGPQEGFTVKGYNGATVVQNTTIAWPAATQTATLNWTGLTKVEFVWANAWGELSDITVAIPEPGSVSVLGLLSLAALRRRRV